MPSIFSIGRTLSRTMPSIRSSSLPRKRDSARRFGQRVLRLVQLHRALGVDLVARRGGERLDLLGLRLALGGDLGGVREAGRRGLFGLRLAGQAQRFALGLARRGDEIGDLAPLGDLPSRAR